MTKLTGNNGASRNPRPLQRFARSTDLLCFHRLDVGERSLAIQDLLAGLVEAHRVVPARGDRNMIDASGVTTEEAGNGKSTRKQGKTRTRCVPR